MPVETENIETRSSRLFGAGAAKQSKEANNIAPVFFSRISEGKINKIRPGRFDSGWVQTDVGMTSSKHGPDAIRIGVAADEPIRVAGLASIFDQPGQNGEYELVPVIAPLKELLAIHDIEYVVIDLHSGPSGLEVVEKIRTLRPDLRSIVIGPDGDDELVLSAIMAGARAYLGQSAGPELVRRAIDVVTAGSIWAPRRLLCRVIDRLMKAPNLSQVLYRQQLTQREQEVLELILGAYSTREIARRLGIEQRTVKAYVGRLMRKTGADNRIQLSMSALSHSFAPGDRTRRAGVGSHESASN
jgi:DNA-binding NarL/FixJ family response regulator